MKHNEIHCIKKEVINTQNSKELPPLFYNILSSVSRSVTLFSSKSPDGKYSSSAMYMIVVAATQFCCTRVKAASDTNWTGVAAFQ